MEEQDAPRRLDMSLATMTNTHPTDTDQKYIGYTDDGQPIVANPGDGSLEEIDHEKDNTRIETRITPFDQARTTFYPRDLNSKLREKKYERLWKYQHHWDDDGSGRRTYRDKINVARSLAEAVGISRPQKIRVVGIASNIDARQFNQNGGIYGLALGAIAYVGDQDAQAAKEMEYRIVDNDRFQDLCDNHGVDGWKASKKVKEVYQDMGP